MRNLLVVIAAIAIACASCSGTPADDNTASSLPDAASAEANSTLSPKARGFISQFAGLLDLQDKARADEMAAKKMEADERLIRTSVAQTLAELRTLDPEEQAQRADELVSDLVDLGEPAYKAVQELLAENRLPKDLVLLLRALSAFKVPGVATELYQYALNAQDPQVQETALKLLANAPEKQKLTSKAVEAVRSSSAAPAGPASLQQQVVHISALGAVGGEEAVQMLADIVRTSDQPEAKKAAIESLSLIKGEEATAALKNIFLNDETSQLIAAQALGSMREGPDHEDVLISFGEVLANIENQEALRVAAVEGLGADNGALARRILFHMLRDTRQSSQVHQQVISMLLRGATLSSEEITTAMTLFESTPVEYLPQMLQPLLASGGDPVAGLLSYRYPTLSALKKIHAVRAIDRIHSDRAFDELQALLTMERDVSQRQEILTAMRHFTGEGAVQTTTTILRSIAQKTSSEQEFTAALRLLGENAPAEAAGIAADQLFVDLGNKDRAQSCIDILKRFGGSDQKNALLSWKVQSGMDEFGPVVDDAVSNIEDRERR